MIINRKTDLEFDYRFPQEFIFYAWKLRHALHVWLLWWWTDEIIGLYKEWGFRILGFEWALRRYKRKFLKNNLDKID